MATTQQSDNVAHAISGAGGGVLSMALTYPLITLSTRAQVESHRSSTPFLSSVRHIIAREGVSGLYSGLSSALFGITVTNFVYYYWYEWARAALQKARGRLRLTAGESMLVGAIAGGVTVVVTNPIWVVNTRMTTRSHGSKEEGEGEGVDVMEKGTGKAVAEEMAETLTANGAKRETSPTTIGTLLSLLRSGGPQALFTGVLPALILVINPILQYTIFEQLKDFFANRSKDRRSITPMVAFLLGALGKLIATTVTYPYITVKSRMHVGGREGKEGMVEGMRRMLREEGLAGFYKGIGPKVSQSVLTAALLFAFKDILYEQTVKLRQRRLIKA